MAIIKLEGSNPIDKAVDWHESIIEAEQEMLNEMKDSEHKYSIPLIFVDARIMIDCKHNTGKYNVDTAVRMFTTNVNFDSPELKKARDDAQNDIHEIIKDYSDTFFRALAKKNGIDLEALK